MAQFVDVELEGRDLTRRSRRREINMGLLSLVKSKKFTRGWTDGSTVISKDDKGNYAIGGMGSRNNFIPRSGVSFTLGLHCRPVVMSGAEAVRFCREWGLPESSNFIIEGYDGSIEIDEEESKQFGNTFEWRDKGTFHIGENLHLLQGCISGKAGVFEIFLSRAQLFSIARAIHQKLEEENIARNVRYELERHRKEEMKRSYESWKQAYLGTASYAVVKRENE